jgi:hypothetical protein
MRSSPVQIILKLIDSLQKRQDNYEQDKLKQNLSLSAREIRG